MTVFFRGKAAIAYCEFRVAGRRYVKRIGRVKTLQEAKDQETLLRAAVLRRDPVAPVVTAAITVKRFFEDHFIPHLYPVPSDHKRHVVSIGRQVAREIGAHPLAAVTPEIVTTYRDVRLKAVSVNQVHREMYWLRRMFRLAIARKLLVDNPAGDIRLPRFQRRRRTLLKRHQDATLLSKVLPSRGTLRDMIELDLYTALRRSEVCDLRLGHVHLRERELRFLTPKTQEERVIPLVDEALAIVKRHWRKGDPEEPLFRSRLGRAYRPQTLWWAYAEARRAAKLHGVRLHDLRHTVAMRLLEAGYEVPIVGEILGHRPPYKTTWMYVAHVNPERRRKAMETLRPTGHPNK